MTRDAAKVPIEASRPIGTWRLIGGTAADADGRSLPPPYGPEPMGLITFTAGGRVMVVSGDGRPALPDGTSRDFGAYCGSYSFDGATLTVTVDGTSSPASRSAAARSAASASRARSWSSARRRRSSTA